MQSLNQKRKKLVKIDDKQKMIAAFAVCESGFL